MAQSAKKTKKQKNKKTKKQKKTKTMELAWVLPKVVEPPEIGCLSFGVSHFFGGIVFVFLLAHFRLTV